MKNDLLHLNKTFNEKDRDNTPFPPTFYQSKSVQIGHLRNLLTTLRNTAAYWASENLLGEQCLISVYCKGIVAKSHRVGELFKFKKTKVNDLVVGARFGDENGKHFHIFT